MSQRFSVTQLGAVVKALKETREKLKEREKRTRGALKALRIAYRNPQDPGLVNLSVALAIHCITGKNPLRSRHPIRKGRKR